MMGQGWRTGNGEACLDPGAWVPEAAARG